MKIDFKINQIELLPIGEVKINPRNPRKIVGKMFEKLKKSIKDEPMFLTLKPLILDENNVVIGGNMRLLACQKLGFETVPVIRATGFTEKQLKRLIVVDNLGFGIWDYDILGNDYTVEELDEMGFDTEFGFPSAEDEEEAPRLDKKNPVELGDIKKFIRKYAEQNGISFRDTLDKLWEEEQG